MDEKLWAGVELKLLYAEFHFDMMGRSIQPPKQTSINVALQASGWQRSFYAYLDAFLSTARSVPEIIQCCFGVRNDTIQRETADREFVESEGRVSRRLKFFDQTSVSSNEIVHFPYSRVWAPICDFRFLKSLCVPLISAISIASNSSASLWSAVATCGR